MALGFTLGCVVVILVNVISFTDCEFVMRVGSNV